MELNKYPLPHSQVAARIVDGSAVIVLADAGEVQVLNSVGTRIWELMDGKKSIGEIATAIEAEYDVTSRQALQDLEELVQQLVNAQAIVLQDYPAAST